MDQNTILSFIISFGHSTACLAQNSNSLPARTTSDKLFTCRMITKLPILKKGINYTMYIHQINQYTQKQKFKKLRSEDSRNDER